MEDRRLKGTQLQFKDSNCKVDKHPVPVEVKGSIQLSSTGEFYLCVCVCVFVCLFVCLLCFSTKLYTFLM
jgi:hypothetical protein